MTTPPASPSGHSADVSMVEVDGREFILVGTAHISRESADLVRQVIEAEQPDCVCIELDQQRYRALSQKHRFESLDLKEIIRSQQLTTLILNLILASYQQQLGGELGVLPGSEFIEAIEIARERGIPVALCDRDVRITLRRAWAAVSIWRRLMLFTTVLASVFERPRLTEEDLRELRRQDVGSKLIQEFGEAFPALKGALIDERDAYLTEKMKRTAGARVVAVVGAGHVEGIRRALLEDRATDLESLEAIPPMGPIWKFVGWGVPLLIVASIAAIGWQQGAAAAGENVRYWVLATGIPGLLGAALALAHPATIVTAFVVAPFTTLTPLIGAGYVAAFVQAYYRPPRVHEIHAVASEFGSPRRWWRNRLLRILLVFVLVSLGSALGTFVAGAEIVSNLF